MCATCGCGDDGGVRVIDLQAPDRTLDDVHPHGRQHPPGHEHPHDLAGGHDHPYEHDHPDAPTHQPPTGRRTTLTLEQRVLAKNDLRAERNRGWLEARDLFAMNLMGSPGAGKTTLLERTVRELGAQRRFYVIEGDQETTLDAARIRDVGAAVLQINTGSGCHLDADMVADGLRTLDPPRGGVVMIENVGNLVCPALFDLGEDDRVVILSVTEGGGKPLKYPHAFRAATLVVLNKIDLLPYVDFDVDRFVADVRLMNPAVPVLQLSATTGDGIAAWYHWLASRADAASAPLASTLSSMAQPVPAG